MPSRRFYLPASLPGATYRALLAELSATARSGGPIPCLLDDAPSRWVSDDPSDEAYAKDACVDCPVLIACGRHGIVADEIGVWGALTRNERRALHKRMPAVVVG